MLLSPSQLSYPNPSSLSPKAIGYSTWNIALHPNLIRLRALPASPKQIQFLHFYSVTILLRFNNLKFSKTWSYFFFEISHLPSIPTLILRLPYHLAGFLLFSLCCSIRFLPFFSFILLGQVFYYVTSLERNVQEICYTYYCFIASCQGFSVWCIRLSASVSNGIYHSSSTCIIWPSQVIMLFHQLPKAQFCCHIV